MREVGLHERSIRRKKNLDPIMLDECDSDDEWIVEKEDPILPKDSSWLDDPELPFTVLARNHVMLIVVLLPLQRNEKLMQHQVMIGVNKKLLK